MKKTITLPNGQTEVVEGTAQEIADYERAKRDEANEGKKSKKKILLTEEQKEEVRELIRAETIGKVLDELTKMPKPDPLATPWIWTQTVPQIGCVHDFPNPWMGVLPPSCRKCGYQAPSMLPTVTLDCTPQLDMSGKTIPGAVKADGCFQQFEPSELDRTLATMLGISSNYSSQA